MELNYRSIEVDDAPYGKFSVRAIFLYKTYSHEGFFLLKEVEEKMKCWLYLDKNGHGVNGWNSNPVECFNTLEEAQKFADWCQSREDKDEIYS